MKRTSDLQYDYIRNVWIDDQNRLYIPVMDSFPPSGYTRDTDAGTFTSPGGRAMNRLRRYG